MKKLTIMTMKNTLAFQLFALLLVSFCSTFLPAQQNIPVILEAELGDVGSEFNIEQEGSVNYVTTSTNGTADSPEISARVISFEVTFPEAQNYDLYVRCRVGSGSFDDDSFFYGNGFGEKTPSSGDDWIRVNGIPNLGFTGATEVVTGDGGAGTGIWKWINLSEFSGDETPAQFSVSEGNLTRIFQIGAREDGLDIDKVAFARAEYFFTVENLDLVEEGSETDPGVVNLEPLAGKEGIDKYLGNVYSNSQVPGFLNYWNQVTPENAGKWGSAEPVQDQMNWTALDNAYALAKDNGLPFRFHVLIWGNQQPGWIENLPEAEQLEEIEEWFQEVADRYPDIDMIEVVNEPLHDPPNSPGSGGGNYIDALGGEGSTGWDWVITSFTLARQYFPNTPLMINDYNIINSWSNTNDYLELIELLQQENLIDKIGVQAHAFTTANATTTTLQNNLDALAETGLPIVVTELDIDGLDDAVQLAEYQRVFPVLWEHPAVEGITLWGWKVGMWRTEQGAYLIDTDGVSERPSVVWLRQYLCDLVQQQNLPASNLVKVFPNPVSGNEITLEGVEDVIKMELYAANGGLIWSGKFSVNPVVIPENLTSGVYLLQVHTAKGLYFQKLVVD